MKSKFLSIRNGIVNKVFYWAIVGLSLNYLHSDDVIEKDKTELTHKLGKYVTLKHKATFEASAGSKNYISDKLYALPFNAKVEYLINFGFDFNKNGDKSLYKIINMDADISAINGVFFVGDILKYKDKCGYYFLDNYIVLNSAKIKWDFAEINKKHQFGTVLYYGKSDYSENEDARFLGIDLNYTLTFDESCKLNKFGMSIGAEFGTDGGLMVYKIMSSINDEKSENYKRLGPSIFTKNNYSEIGLSAVIPRICLSTSFNFEKGDSSLKFFINPFGNIIVGSSYLDFMPWGVMFNANIKYGLSNKFSATIRVGNDELSSYYFFDSYIDGFEKKSDMLYSSDRGIFYALVRPFIINQSTETNLHFEHHINAKVDFIKEITVNILEKVESLFKIASYNGDVVTKNILPSDFYFYKDLFAEVSITPSIKFNDKVSSHNKKLWFLNNLEASALSLTFFLKPTIKCSREGSDPVKIEVERPKFGIKGTLLNSKLNFGNGHYLESSFVTLEYFNNEFKWSDLINVSYTFNLTEFLNNNR